MALLPLLVALISPSIPYQCSVWGAQWSDWGGTQKTFQRLCALCVCVLCCSLPLACVLPLSEWKCHLSPFSLKEKILFHSFVQVVVCWCNCVKEKITLRYFYLPKTSSLVPQSSNVRVAILRQSWGKNSNAEVAAMSVCPLAVASCRPECNAAAVLICPTVFISYSSLITLCWHGITINTINNNQCQISFLIFWLWKGIVGEIGSGNVSLKHTTSS